MSRLAVNTLAYRTAAGQLRAVTRRLCHAGAPLAGALVAAAVCGCRTPAPACPAETALTVLAAGIDDPDNCCTLLAGGAAGVTGVRFPTSVAVARLAARENPAATECSGPGDPARPEVSTEPPRAESSFGASTLPGEMLAPDAGAGLCLTAISPADQGRWVEAFRGLTFVRDLRFLSPTDMKSQAGDVPAMLAAAQRASAGLLLTYCQSRCGPNSGRLLGIVYAVDSGQPLARLQSHMQFLNDAGEECSVDEERGDQRERDAAYQAAREFECRAVACVRELGRRTPATNTIEPHRWIPLYPYCWQPVPRQSSPYQLPPPPCLPPGPPVPPAAPGGRP